jgi:toxin ParE1/3/4
MNKLIRTSRAELDIIGIGLELTRFGPRVAERTLDLIENRCEVIRQFPYGGEACAQFGERMRWYPAGNYVIFYLPDDDGIQVVRVLDGRRDLQRAFWRDY